MLFKDIFNEKTKKLQPEFEKLREEILKKQTHDGDLLLILTNGSYEPDVHNWTNVKEDMSPYVIGPNSEGYSDHSHYDFIHNYRTKSISNLNFVDYLKLHEWSKERKTEIDQLQNDESLSLQLEMLVFLKIWEADLFIKKWFQLTRLSLGEPYDWHFSIAESNRDKEATGTRETLIRKKIRDRLESQFPEIYKTIKNAYRTQVRNSIAHSKYSFLGRNIHLNNYIKEDKASQLHSLKFDEWIDMFHDTMVLYNQTIRLFNKADQLYDSFAKANNLLVEVRINKLDPEEKTEYQILKYRPELKDWGWYRNEKK